MRLGLARSGVATCLLLAPAAARGGAALVAAFDYSMPPRFEIPALPEPQSPSPVATRYFSGPVHPAAWRVDLDACASTGPIASFTWRVDGRHLSTSDRCDGVSFESDSGERHLVTLGVADAAGRTVSTTREVLVQDWLVVGLGNSYGSGEGSPDQPVSLDAAEAAQQAFDAAAAADQLLAWQLAQQDYAELIALLNAASARLAEWLDAVEERNDACDNFPPTPVQCATAQLALSQAAARLVAALTALGLEALFGSPTLAGVLADLRASAEHALGVARALFDAAVAARDAALETLLAEIASLEPRWQSRLCHRSALSGQVQAARLLEEADPRSSVRFIHLACSGAKIGAGLLATYGGQEKDDALEGDLQPQVDEAARLAEGRAIDALVVSIGGNDVNFAKTIEECVTSEPCFGTPAPDDPTASAFAAQYCAS
jgi:hypothetical protein